jgi:hypothetical protein
MTDISYHAAKFEENLINTSAVRRHSIHGWILLPDPVHKTTLLTTRFMSVQSILTFMIATRVAPPYIPFLYNQLPSLFHYSVATGLRTIWALSASLPTKLHMLPVRWTGHLAGGHGIHRKQGGNGQWGRLTHAKKGRLLEKGTAKAVSGSRKGGIVNLWSKIRQNDRY